MEKDKDDRSLPRTSSLPLRACASSDESIPLLQDNLHHDENLFWQECFEILEECRDHFHGAYHAFSVGAMCAAAAAAGGYPTRDVLRLAAKQDARIFGGFVISKTLQTSRPHGGQRPSTDGGSNLSESDSKEE